MQKYYKLLRGNEESGLFSYYAAGVLFTEYKLDFWTYAPKPAFNFGYGLFVFTEEGIKSFVVDGLSGSESWECEIGDNLKLPHFRIDGDTFPNSYDEVVSIFNSLQTNPYARSKWPSASWPKGTVMTDKVKLVRQVVVKDGIIYP